MSMKSILLSSRGPKPKNNNLLLLNEFKKEEQSSEDKLKAINELHS